MLKRFGLRGQGVALGMETEPADWERIIVEHAAGDFSCRSTCRSRGDVPHRRGPVTCKMRLKRFNITPSA